MNNIRTIKRNFDIDEHEDFDLNVQPFVHPLEIIQPVKEYTGQMFCGVEVDDTYILTEWNIITPFRK